MFFFSFVPHEPLSIALFPYTTLFRSRIRSSGRRTVRRLSLGTQARTHFEEDAETSKTEPERLIKGIAACPVPCVLSSPAPPTLPPPVSKPCWKATTVWLPFIPSPTGRRVADASSPPVR